jgi:DNA primase
MSTETTDSAPSPHLPLALIAITILIILIAQVGASKQSATFIKWQRENLEKQITQADAVDKQAADAIKNRETVVKQAGEIQNQLQTLLNDLLELSKDDKDAKDIIGKWNVQRNAPAGAAPTAGATAPAAATPAPATAPK